MVALFDRYFSEHARPNKKASSLAEDERLIKADLKPGFARHEVAEVKRADADKFHKGLAGKPYLANRLLALLSKAFNLTEMWGWRPNASNLCRHVGRDCRYGTQSVNTAPNQGLCLQIPEQRHRHHCAKTRVHAHEHPDTSLANFHGPQRIARYLPRQDLGKRRE